MLRSAKRAVEREVAPLSNQGEITSKTSAFALLMLMDALDPPLKDCAGWVSCVFHVTNPASTLLNWVRTKHIWTRYPPLVAPLFGTIKRM